MRSRVINLSELSPSLTCDAMKTHLLSAVQAVFGLPPKAIAEIGYESIRSYVEHFSDKEYLYGSPIPFDVSCEGQLPFGNVRLELCVKSGHISELRLYTDALNAELSEIVKRALVSLPFELRAIRNALFAALAKADADALVSLLSDQIFS